MVTRPSKPAAAAVKPAEKPKKVYTARAAQETAEKLAKRRERILEAARWCIETGKGGQAARSSGLIGDVTRNEVNPMVKKLRLGKPVHLRDHHSQILLNKERVQVAEWILACCDNQDPKDRTEVTEKIRQVLRARHADNKRRKYGTGSVPLNREELECIKSKEDEISHMFFSQGFYPWCRAHGIKIHEGVDRAQDEARAKKMNEATVQRHFYAEFGLEAELLDVKPQIMDPDTKVRRTCATQAPASPILTVGCPLPWRR
jgi:hypothetical protein